MFDGIPKNAVICLDSTKAPEIYKLANKISCVTISCETNWKSVQKDMITTYKYEYQGKCYTICPENTNVYMNKCYSCSSNCKTCSYEENKPSNVTK